MGGNFHPHSGGIAPLSAVRAVCERTNPRCHATASREPGCSLSLQKAPKPNVLLNLEHETAPVEASAPRCDYLFVGGDEQRGEWVAPVELTASAARVSKFLPQLRAGAEIASNLLPRDVQVRFRPIAAYGGELRRSERDNFLKKANHVVFRNKPTPVKLVRCGSPLTKALSG